MVKTKGKGKGIDKVRELLAAGQIAFRPHFTKLARDAHLPISTVHDAWNYLVESRQVELVARYERTIPTQYEIVEIKQQLSTAKQGR